MAIYRYSYPPRRERARLFQCPRIRLRLLIPDSCLYLVIIVTFICAYRKAIFITACKQTSCFHDHHSHCRGFVIFLLVHFS